MIVVFGSINLDLVTKVPRFPAPGETVGGGSFATYPGGKGANQALAAARAGASVRMYGAVGRDAFAEPALALLSKGGVDLAGVARVAAPTGCATIMVDALGENCIAVAAGANTFADPDAVPDGALGSGTTLILQHEVSGEANAALIARMRRRCKRSRSISCVKLMCSCSMKTRLRRWQPSTDGRPHLRRSPPRRSQRLLRSSLSW
jgi:ribokinase